MSKEYTIRVMTLEDYDEVWASTVLESVPSMIPKKAWSGF